MIICDSCSAKISGNFRVVNKATSKNPYAEEHWCRECNTAYVKIHAEEKAKLKSILDTNIKNRMKAHLLERCDETHNNN